jgi:hypothetical protein
VTACDEMAAIHRRTEWVRRLEAVGFVIVDVPITLSSRQPPATSRPRVPLPT